MKHKHTLALLTSASLSMACCLQLTESFSAPEATAAQPETVTAAVPAAATDSRINSVTFTPIDKNGKIFANVDLDITERGQLIVCIYTRTNAFADGNAAQQMCGIGASASEKTNTIIAPGTKQYLWK